MLVLQLSSVGEAAGVAYSYLLVATASGAAGLLSSILLSPFVNPRDSDLKRWIYILRYLPGLGAVSTGLPARVMPIPATEFFLLLAYTACATTPKALLQVILEN
jgi:hypothetical protein